MLKSFIDSQNVVRFLTVSLILFGVVGCTQTSDKEQPEPTDSAPAISLVEGSDSQTEVPKKVVQVEEGSGSDVGGHPDVRKSEKPERRVHIPKAVEGKWKAVKILVRNKSDKGKNELKTVEIGSSFMLGGAGIKVTVGPFLPNFVMDQGTYTSMNNQVLNPAVQLLVEENGKILYKGWTFAKYPAMYAFEHEVYALELKDHIPVDVS